MYQAQQPPARAFNEPTAPGNSSISHGSNPKTDPKEISPRKKKGQITFAQTSFLSSLDMGSMDNSSDRKVQEDVQFLLAQLQRAKKENEGLKERCDTLDTQLSAVHKNFKEVSHQRIIETESFKSTLKEMKDRFDKKLVKSVIRAKDREELLYDWVSTASKAIDEQVNQAMNLDSALPGPGGDGTGRREGGMAAMNLDSALPGPGGDGTGRREGGMANRATEIEAVSLDYSSVRPLVQRSLLLLPPDATKHFSQVHKRTRNAKGNLSVKNKRSRKVATSSTPGGKKTKKKVPSKGFNPSNNSKFDKAGVPGLNSSGGASGTTNDPEAILAIINENISVLDHFNRRDGMRNQSTGAHPLDSDSDYYVIQAGSQVRDYLSPDEIEELIQRASSAKGEEEGRGYGSNAHYSDLSPHARHPGQDSNSEEDSDLDGGHGRTAKAVAPRGPFKHYNAFNENNETSDGDDGEDADAADDTSSARRRRNNRKQKKRKNQRGGGAGGGSGADTAEDSTGTVTGSIMGADHDDDDNDDDEKLISKIGNQETDRNPAAGITPLHSVAPIDISKLPANHHNTTKKAANTTYAKEEQDGAETSLSQSHQASAMSSISDSEPSKFESRSAVDIEGGGVGGGAAGTTAATVTSSGADPSSMSLDDPDALGALLGSIAIDSEDKKNDNTDKKNTLSSVGATGERVARPTATVPGINVQEPDPTALAAQLKMKVNHQEAVDQSHNNESNTGTSAADSGKNNKTTNDTNDTNETSGLPAYTSSLDPAKILPRPNLPPAARKHFKQSKTNDKEGREPELEPGKVQGSHDVDDDDEDEDGTYASKDVQVGEDVNPDADAAALEVMKIRSKEDVERNRRIKQTACNKGDNSDNNLGIAMDNVDTHGDSNQHKNNNKINHDINGNDDNDDHDSHPSLNVLPGGMILGEASIESFIRQAGVLLDGSGSGGTTAAGNTSGSGRILNEGTSGGGKETSEHTAASTPNSATSNNNNKTQSRGSTQSSQKRYSDQDIEGMIKAVADSDPAAALSSYLGIDLNDDEGDAVGEENGDIDFDALLGITKKLDTSKPEENKSNKSGNSKSTTGTKKKSKPSGSKAATGTTTSSAAAATAAGETTTSSPKRPSKAKGKIGVGAKPTATNATGATVSVPKISSFSTALAIATAVNKGQDIATATQMVLNAEQEQGGGGGAHAAAKKKGQKKNVTPPRIKLKNAAKTVVNAVRDANDDASSVDSDSISQNFNSSSLSASGASKSLASKSHHSSMGRPKLTSAHVVATTATASATTAATASTRIKDDINHNNHNINNNNNKTNNVLNSNSSKGGRSKGSKATTTTSGAEGSEYSFTFESEGGGEPSTKSGIKNHHNSVAATKNTTSLNETLKLGGELDSQSTSTVNSK